MPAIAIDACCLIDVLASGHAEAILRVCGHDWRLPTAVKDEIRFVRRYDPTDSSLIVSMAADLTPLISTGLLKVCQPDKSAELDLFTRYAALFRSDGEAMCLALAESRGWSIATDDKKAMRIAEQAGLDVVSSPRLLKLWADSEHPDQSGVTKALKDIERLAQFRPNSAMPECKWWTRQAPS